MICAVCGTPSKAELCSPCADDPANVDWVSGREELGTKEDATTSEATRRRGIMHEMIGREVKGPTAKQRKILELATKGYKPVRYQYIDRQGRARGYRTEKRPLTLTEIAAKARVTVQYVHRVIRTIKIARGYPKPSSLARARKSGRT